MRITRAVVPSLFTILNIVCGFLSILNASERNIEVAAWFIILAAIFDSLDGIMARITRSSSQFGVELDSLCDVVSFGAAPSFLIYQAHLFSYNTFGIIVSAMPLVFGAIRLARFNVQLVGFEKEFFKGLPIPFAAITICSFVLAYHSSENGLHGWAGDLFAPLIILLSLLMVSRVRYDTLPKFTKKGLKSHPWRVASVIVVLLIIIISQGLYLFEVLFAVTLFGILRSAYEKVRSLTDVTDTEEEGSEISSIDL